MALPELDVARVQRWCAARVPRRPPPGPRRVRGRARHLTIVERVPWREEVGPEWTTFPIARLRYTSARQVWTLYWRDRNLRFHLYDQSPRHAESTTCSPSSTATPPASSGANTPTAGRRTAPATMYLVGLLQAGGRLLIDRNA